MNADLIKKILIAADEVPFGEIKWPDNTGFTEREVAKHIEFCVNNDLILGERATRNSVGKELVYVPKGITLKGQDYLDKMKRGSVLAFIKFVNFVETVLDIAISLSKQ